MVPGKFALISFDNSWKTSENFPQNRRMKWRHTTRGTTISSKVTDSCVTAHDDDQFTSSSEGEDADIDVVTDN